MVTFLLPMLALGLGSGQPAVAGVELDVQVLAASQNPLPAGAQASRATRDLAGTLTFKSVRVIDEEKKTPPAVRAHGARPAKQNACRSELGGH